MIPKYAILEIERRWLARSELLPELGSLDHMLVEDVYFPGTRMRLRKMTGAGSIVYKLAKKYGKISSIEEPIVNIYLDENEYSFFAALPGRRLVRRRFHFHAGGRTYSINMILEGEGPIIVEAEYESREIALRDVPPPFCGDEISNDVFYEAVKFAGIAQSGKH